MPTNFKSYEAQSRLLVAVIASNPSMRLNFKAIALHYGSDSTASALEHRFRPLKKQAAIIQKAVAQGKDAKELQDMFLLSDKEIAKYFGESTHLGIEFQFRSIRKEAKSLREAVDNGESPLAAKKTTASPSTRVSSAGGSQRKRKAPAATASAGAGVARTTQASPKKRARAIEIFSNEEDSVTSEVNYDELDVTPVSTPARHGLSSASTATPVSAAPSYIDLAATTPASTATYVQHATPALSIGATPTDESPDAAHDEFHTAPRTQGQNQNQNQNQTPRQAFLATYNMSHFDDDEDDDILFVDTPSKAPKMAPGPRTTASAPVDVKPLAVSPPQQHASSFATVDNDLNDYSLGSSSWDTLSQEPAQSHAVYSFDGSDTWTQPDLYSDSGTVQSFGQEASFYDDDAAI